MGVLLVGALGELVGPALFGPLPGWEKALLSDLAVLGVAVGLVSPFLLGASLPLTE